MNSKYRIDDMMRVQPLQRKTLFGPKLPLKLFISKYQALLDDMQLFYYRIEIVCVCESG